MTTDKASKRAHRSPFQSKHIPSAVFCAAASYRIRSIRTALPARPTCLNSCLIAYRLSKAEGEVEERDESLSSRHATRSRVVSRWCPAYRRHVASGPRTLAALSAHCVLQRSPWHQYLTTSSAQYQSMFLLKSSRKCLKRRRTPFQRR